MSDFYRLLNFVTLQRGKLLNAMKNGMHNVKSSHGLLDGITILHSYFIWILHCPFHKVLLFSNVNVNNVQWVADLQLQY